MRWIAKKYPNIGDKRIIKRFAWFPTLIDNEYVWLEYIEVYQIYRELSYRKNGCYYNEWIDTHIKW